MIWPYFGPQVIQKTLSLVTINITQQFYHQTVKYHRICQKLMEKKNSKFFQLKIKTVLSENFWYVFDSISNFCTKLFFSQSHCLNNLPVYNGHQFSIAVYDLYKEDKISHLHCTYIFRMVFFFYKIIKLLNLMFIIHPKNC